MNQSLAQLCCKKHPRLRPGLGGTSCSSLAENIPATWLYLLGHLVGTWKSFFFFFFNPFYPFALLISIHLSGFDVHLHSLLKP